MTTVPAYSWEANDDLRLGDVVFNLIRDDEDNEDRLTIFKPRAEVEAFIELLATASADRIVEIGIHKGGSTALLAHVSNPSKLVALDIRSEPVIPLERHLEAHGFTETVALHYGVDQADDARLRQILASEFEGAPLDLVIDDASHDYLPTLASFDTLFPYLRPGGLYVVEDWQAEYLLHFMFLDGMRRRDELGVSFDDDMARLLQGPESVLFKRWWEGERAKTQSTNWPVMQAWLDTALNDPHSSHAELFERELGENAGALGQMADPLIRLPIDLLLASTAIGVITELVVGPWWVAARRGPAALEPGRFSLTDLAPLSVDLHPRSGAPSS
jgi:predicted O-methyltransferase YrrM